MVTRLLDINDDNYWVMTKSNITKNAWLFWRGYDTLDEARRQARERFGDHYPFLIVEPVIVRNPKK